VGITDTEILLMRIPLRGTPYAGDRRFPGLAKAARPAAPGQTRVDLKSGSVLLVRCWFLVSPAAQKEDE
jgi:hypothetical protein